ncbi:MAG TPA: hypothetical protein VFZ05_01030, partial [Nitrososphaera sp.]
TKSFQIGRSDTTPSRVPILPGKDEKEKVMCTYGHNVSVEVHFLIPLNGRSAQVSVITGIA